VLGLPALGRLARADDPAPPRVLVWSEGTAPASVYPDGIDGALKDALPDLGLDRVAAARLDDPEAGLADAALDAADVLVWWGRLRHDEVPEARAKAVAERVKAGTLGLVALFGSYASKPFRELMGRPCEPGGWREDGGAERVELQTPDHPIAEGLDPFTIPRSRVFAEPFAVPEPEAVVLSSAWDGGETFRSGLAWTVEKGRVAYLRQADDAFPVLYHPAVRRLIANAARWAAPGAGPSAGG
jgi:trehalose utilization protein